MASKPKEIKELEDALGIDQVDYFEVENGIITSLSISFQNISDISPLKKLRGLTSLDLPSNQISDLNPINELSGLISLNLGGNQILDISPLMELHGLASLSLYSNLISDISPLMELKGLTTLDLGFNQINYFSPLEELHRLTSLNLSGNHISDISPLKKLQGLTSLNLSVNQISNLSPLKELQGLLSIDLRENQIHDSSPLKELQGLKVLELSNNQISDISPLKELKELTWLDLSRNQILDISPLKELKGLTLLSLWGNQISDLSPVKKLQGLTELSLGDNQLSDISSLRQLNKLQKLYLSRNKISDLLPIKDLSSVIDLRLGENRISDIFSLKNLTSLKKIDLGLNQISDISPVKDLALLEFIDLSYNKISDISNLVSFLKNGIDVTVDPIYRSSQRLIRLSSNPLTTPPIEIIEQGNLAVLAYFEDIEKYGEFEILEGKLLIVGEPSAGKTTLRKKIFNPEYVVPSTEDKETIGVYLQKGWTFPYLFEGSKVFTANIWDFGGQERQYPLHQFFMDDVSSYVLVSDDRTDNTNMDKWFTMIKLLGGHKEDVLVVLNQKNRKVPTTNFNKEKYEKQGFSIDTFPIDFSNDKSTIHDLINAIKSRLSSLPHVGTVLPRSICEPIRNEIIRLKNDENKNYLTFEEFEAACKKVKLTNNEEKEKALKYLCLIGDVIHYGADHLLQNIIILDPLWLTDAIYSIITLKELDEFHKKGMFTREWFYHFMASEQDNRKVKYSKAESNHILSLMLKNNLDICYTSDDENFLIPLCMPEQLPQHYFDESNGLTCIFKYEQIPPGMLSRLIVRLSNYIYRNLVSSSSVVLHKNEAQAKIEEHFVQGDANQFLKISVTGLTYQKSEFLNEIKNTLKDIKQKWFPNITYEEQIPCICDKCKRDDSPYLHDITFLSKRINNNKNTSDCKKYGDDVSISKLLGHVNDVQFNILLEIRRELESVQKELEMNVEFNLAFSAAFLEINETIMNIHGNTEKKSLTQVQKLFEKGKIAKDLVSITSIPTDFISKIEKLYGLLNY